MVVSATTNRPNTGAGGSAEYDYIIKLVLIGDSGVGKSSLLLRFIDDKFSPAFITTIGIDFKVKTLEIDGKKVKLQVWDTAGQERFRTITQAYYRGAHGILVVYDISEPSSFKNISGWLDTVNKNTNSDSVVKMLVGTKVDMRKTGLAMDTTTDGRVAGSDKAEKEMVTYEMGENYRKQAGFKFFVETSAYQDRNVKDAFHMITAECIKNVATLEKKKDNTVDISAKNNEGGLRSRCCSRS